MTWLHLIVCFWIALALFPAPGLAEDTVQDERQKAFAELKPGKLLRISCEDHGRTGGRLALIEADSLVLEADRRCNSHEVSRRRALRLSPAAAANLKPAWQSVDRLTTIRLADVREMHVRSNATGTGALVGGIVLGAGCLGLAIGLSSIDDGGGSNSGDVVRFTAVGLMLGAGVGAIIGSMIPAWHMEYRQPGRVAHP